MLIIGLYNYIIVYFIIVFRPNILDASNGIVRNRDGIRLFWKLISLLYNDMITLFMCSARFS